VVKVSASCHAATAGAPACAAVAYAPLGVTFNAMTDATFTSSDADDDAIFFTWDWNDGSPVEGGYSPVRTHTFARGITYNVVVTGHDLRGGVTPATVPVRALPLNCEILTGSLYNGNRTDELSYVRLKRNNNQAWTGAFSLTATTNSACTTLKARVPIATGQLNLTSSTSTLSSDGATRAWTLTGDFGNAKLDIGVQKVSFTGTQSDATRPEVVLAVDFTAAYKDER
jgi:hypothetical protein